MKDTCIIGLASRLQFAFRVRDSVVHHMIFQKSALGSIGGEYFISFV